MSDDQILTFFLKLIVFVIILWLISRWQNSNDTPNEDPEGVKPDDRSREPAKPAGIIGRAYDGDPQRAAETARVPLRTEGANTHRPLDEERSNIITTPIGGDILREMSEFLNANQSFGEEHSPLAYVGYRVGKTNGLGVLDRRRRLTACFQIDIPRQLADKYHAWGQPVSYRRFICMCKHLAMLADMRRQRHNYEVAVSDWETDLEWFKAEYGSLANSLRKKY